MSSLDAIVVGGGPAGSAIGTLLARLGRNVTIIEKSIGPTDQMCGEFYSEEATQYLSALDIDVASLGAMPIKRVRIASQEGIAETVLPFPGYSLRRKIVDDCLLNRAALSGATVVRGTTVESLVKRNGEWRAQLSDGEQRHAKDAFVATGKHDLRGHARSPGLQNGLIAFKMYFSLTPVEEEQLESCVELILFRGGYAGLQLIGRRCANLSLLIKKDEFRRCGSNWSGLVRHVTSSSRYLAQRLTDAVALLEKPLALSSIPYGYRRIGVQDEPWYLGDQCAVIPSFTGDGMSIALHTAFVAADSWRRGDTALRYQERMAMDLRRPVLLATHLAKAATSAPFLANLLRLHPNAIAWIASQTRIPLPLRAPKLFRLSDDVPPSTAS